MATPSVFPVHMDPNRDTPSLFPVFMLAEISDVVSVIIIGGTKLLGSVD